MKIHDTKSNQYYRIIKDGYIQDGGQGASINTVHRKQNNDSVVAQQQVGYKAKT